MSHDHGNDKNLDSWLPTKGDTFQGNPKGLKENAVKQPKKAKAVPKKAPKVEPMKAGEKQDLAKVSVGNILPEAMKKLMKQKKKKES